MYYSRDDKDYNNALFSSLPFYSVRCSSSYSRMQIILPFTKHLYTAVDNYRNGNNKFSNFSFLSNIRIENGKMESLNPTFSFISYSVTVLITVRVLTDVNARCGLLVICTCTYAIV